MKGLEHQRRGFTLIELLVVIAILAILAGFLFPVFAQAKRQAEGAVCLSNMQQLAKAHLLYTQDWDECLPHWYYYTDKRRPEPYGGFVFWTDFFQPYLKNKGVFADPHGTIPKEGLLGHKLADYCLMTWGKTYRSYYGEGTIQSPFWRWPGDGMLLSEVVRPSETSNLMDGYTTTHETRNMVVTQHGGLNAGFLDGHAEWLPYNDLRQITQGDDGKYHFTHFTATR